MCVGKWKISTAFLTVIRNKVVNKNNIAEENRGKSVTVNSRNILIKAKELEEQVQCLPCIWLTHVRSHYGILMFPEPFQK